MPPNYIGSGRERRQGLSITQRTNMSQGWRFDHRTPGPDWQFPGDDTAGEGHFPFGQQFGGSMIRPRSVRYDPGL